MGLLEFSKLPINTLVGADWQTFKAITAGRDVDPAYRGKYRLTKAVCRLLSVLAPIQDRRYESFLADRPLEHDPVFILGHWRSGTTFVHNVLSCDRHFGYNTTYQTVFPHLMMWGQPFFKKNMAWLMPDKRPTDNMELAVDLPQEEEFALANMMPYTYYNFWFLPKYMLEYCDRYMLFEGITQDELRTFEETFTKLIKISLWNTKGTQFLSKNPPHTGRVRELVKMFPNAKFIYLMRNPYTVFESTRSFFTNTIQPLKLEDISPEELEKNILTVYERLYHKYEADKACIPTGNLIEVKFEDFEADALGITEKIYRTLSLPGWDEAHEAIARYVGSKKGYKRAMDRSELLAGNCLRCLDLLSSALLQHLEHMVVFAPLLLHCIEALGFGDHVGDMHHAQITERDQKLILLASGGCNDRFLHLSYHINLPSPASSWLSFRAQQRPSADPGDRFLSP